MQRKILFPLLFTALLLTFSASANAGLTIEPFATTFVIDAEDSSGMEFTLTNDTEDDLEFRIKAKVVEYEEEENGPRRDDRGDEIEDKVVDLTEGVNSYKGLSWDYDNDYLFSSSYTSNYVRIYDPEANEELSNLAGVSNCMDNAYLEGIYYAQQYANATCNMLVLDEDGELERLGTFAWNGSCYGIAADKENDWLIVENGSQNYRIEVWTLDEDREPDEMLGTITNWREYTNNSTAYNLEWVPAHRDIGALWIHYTTTCYQIAVDEDEWECVDIEEDGYGSFQVQSTYYYEGMAHDGEDLWVTGYGYADAIAYDDGISESYLIEFLPYKGIVEANSELTIDCIVDSRGVPEASYEFDVTFSHEEMDEMFTFFVHVGSPSAMVSGSVASAASGGAMEGVDVMLNGFKFPRMTDAEGMFEIGYLAPADYSFDLWKPEYLPMTYEFSVDEEDEAVELDIELLHSECNIEDADRFYAFEQGDFIETDLVISNDGDGTLEYEVEYILERNDGVSQWDELERFNVEEILEDDGYQSVLFIDNQYYVATSTDYMIVVLDRDGSIDRSFEQPTTDGTGFRDMAWDGEYIWGGDADSIYAINLDGERMMAYPGPDAGSPNRCLAWDPMNELVWVCTNDNVISGVDPADGSTQQTVDIGNRPASHSLEIYPFDPDGYYLYTTSRPGFGELLITKINPETETFMTAYAYDDDFDRIYGTHITPLFDEYSWALVGIVQNVGDIVALNIDNRTDWMMLDQNAGSLEAGQEHEFVLTLDAMDMLDATYNGIIRFHHNGFNFNSDLLLDFNVSQGSGELEHVLDMNAGWSMISSNVQPAEADIATIFADLIDRGVLKIMKDDHGNFMIPDFDVNNLTDWNVKTGYSLLLTERSEVTIAGTSVSRLDTIQLDHGWQIVSYLPRFPIEATVALSGIEDNLTIAKNDQGGFWVPDYGFSNMRMMGYGEGYFLRMEAEDELIYRVERADDEGAALYADNRSLDAYDLPGELPAVNPTGENMSLLIKSGEDFSGEVGVYAGGRLVGSGTIQNGSVGIAVWGDNAATDAIDGAIAGDKLTLRTVDGRQLIFAEINGEAVYTTDAFAVLEVTGTEVLPQQFGIMTAYPNPFNSSMRISYNLIEQGIVDVAVFDLSGRKVATLFSGNAAAGVHYTNLEGSALASGVYLLRVSSAGQTSQQKIALIK
ncbi:T9SS type A sorting domain-containing protein [Calditrichota bacterium]